MQSKVKHAANISFSKKCCAGLDTLQATMKAGYKEITTKSKTLKRRKLWELEHNYHCAVIGTCLSMAEVRNLLKHFQVKVSEYCDYEIHTIAVTMIEENDNRTKKINNHLDRKFKTIIQKVKKMDYQGLQQQWHMALKTGDMIGVFWAIISHPLADDKLQRNIYGDIHMLSHLSGASNRADLKQLQTLQQQHKQLHEEVQQWKSASHKKHAEIEQLKHENKDQSRTIGFVEQKINSLQTINEQLLSLNSEKNRQQMQQQIGKTQQKLLKQENKIHILEERNRQLLIQLSSMENQHRESVDSISSYQLETQQLQDSILQLSNSDTMQQDCNQCELKDESLCGRCILYVGGQTNLTTHYKDIVEGKSAVFLHHDGGIEKNAQELKSMLNRADVVICPTSCISHKAYWQIKKTCKKQNKPCKFIQSSGTSTLAHILESIGNEAIEVINA